MNLRLTLPLLAITALSLTQALFAAPPPSGTPTSSTVAGNGTGISDPAAFRNQLQMPIGKVSDESVVMGAVMPRTLARTQWAGSNRAHSLTCISAGDSFTLDMGIAAEKLLGHRTSSGGGADMQFTFYGDTTLKYPDHVSTFDWTRSINGKYIRVENTKTAILSPGGNSVYMRKLFIFYTAENGGGSFKVEQDVGAGYVANGLGTPQVETTTAVGTITTAGNAAVTVTGSGITGSPVTIMVAVTLGDTPATWAEKVRVGLANNAAVSALYFNTGTANRIELTRIGAAADDGTLNIAVANGTCTGITADANSDNTRAGVASGAGDWVISTDNGGAITPMVAVYDWASSTKRKIRLTGTTAATSVVWGICGSDRFLGTGAAKGGFEPFHFGMSGADVNDQKDVAQGFFDLCYGSLRPDFVVWKSDDHALSTKLPTWLGKVNASTPAGEIYKPDYIFVGPHQTTQPDASPDLDFSDQDVDLIALAKSSNGTFVNSKALFRTVSMIQELGIGDALHLSTSGNEVTIGVIAQAVYNRLGLSFSNNRTVPQPRGYGPVENWLDKGGTIFAFRSNEGAGNGTDVYTATTPDDLGIVYKIGLSNRAQFNGSQWMWGSGNHTLGTTNAYNTSFYSGAGHQFHGNTFNAPVMTLAGNGSPSASTPILDLWQGVSRRASIIQNGTYQAETIGAGIAIKTGTNSKIGTGATLASGTVTVANTSVTANSHIVLTKTANGGTAGNDYVVTKSAGTSFTITAVNTSGTTVTSDTSTFDWQITERIP